MINSQLSNGTTSNGTAKHLLVDKQLTGVPKKTALRDVQNQNGGLITNHRESSLLLSSKIDSEGGTRVCGNKRLTPERPSSPVCHLSLASNGANDHIINARRRIELELGRGRTQNDLEKYVESILAKRVCQPQKEVPPKANQLKENNVSNASITMPDNIISAGKSNNRVPRSAQADSAKLISDKSQSVEFMVADDQQRTERFACLQMLLKKCDESDYSDYIQMLLHLSPSELSRHAVDLEKRAIQLAIDEGKEINRGKTLNILGKSPPDPTSLQTAPLIHSKHEH